MNKKAFTLIEILIVIAIIGILSTAFLPSILGAPSKGRDAARIETINKVGDFLILKNAEGVALPDVLNYDYFKADGTSYKGDFADFLTPYIADFGGVFPGDPMPDWCAIAGEGACTGNSLKEYRAGAFRYNDDPTGDGTYLFVLTAHVENPENGNNTHYQTPDTLNPEDPDDAVYYTYFGTK